MDPHELWLTARFNDYFSGAGNAINGLVGIPSQPRPWANYIVMEILVAIIIMVLFTILRGQLSMDRPGKLQHTFEAIYKFLYDQSADIIGHDGPKYFALCGTLFIFVLFSNLIGVIPPFESPTMYAPVTAGCAFVAFLYYNFLGVSVQGIFNYLKHFAGPMLWLAPLMIPIEIVSHLARPLSLTIRLYANMLAGEKVTLAFLGLTYLFVPALFMGLHVFVSLLQAYVFAVLTMIYVGGAVAHEEH